MNMISRRRLLTSAAANAIGMTLQRASVFAQSGIQPKIGDPRSTFDSWFGTPTPVDAYLHYPPLAASRASYFVLPDANGLAETIVGNFHDLAGGGIDHRYDDLESIGQSQFVPDWLAAGPLATFGLDITEFGAFGVRGWADDSGTVVVMDRLVRGEVMGSQLFKETFVVRNSSAPFAITPTQTQLGPHSSYDQWQQYPGGVGIHQYGFDLRMPPAAGNWSVYGRGGEVSVALDQPQSVEDNSVLVGSMLPLGELEWSAWIPASPITPWQIRLSLFRASATGAQYLSAQFVDGDESAGTVSRFHLTTAAYT